RDRLGLDGICTVLSAQVLADASPLWKQNRAASEVMRLFDLPRLPDVRDEDFKEIVALRARGVIIDAPNSSKLKQDLAACDRIFKAFNNDEAEIRDRVRIAYNKSQPLIVLNKAILTGKDAGFTPATNSKVAIVGGSNATDPAAVKLLPLLVEKVESKDAVTPLGEEERHRIVFVQEKGGFSLRCLDGMGQLRRSYQDWKGQTIEAKRARLRGESKDLPIPVHTQKEPPFWDVFPDNEEVYELVVRGRSLEVLRLDENRSTKERVIRYTRQSAIGEESVDIASTWEEAVQVLDVDVCRGDREEIARQVKEKLNAAETNQQKRLLYEKLMAYLASRELELEKQGGKDSLIYKREAKIVEKIIDEYKLLVEGGVKGPVVPEVKEEEPVDKRSSIFCTNCGAKNPMASNFCYKCGTKLTKVG
ncbi:MAG: zinc ribbon domain-containing protein, partial [Okeania sp. SIO2H7]|nr:zinc ribbon domain-containing protein [Okeania sp. SIO2H7]